MHKQKPLTAKEFRDDSQRAVEPLPPAPDSMTVTKIPCAVDLRVADWSDLDVRIARERKRRLE